jgi:hypothetical protein
MAPRARAVRDEHFRFAKREYKRRAEKKGYPAVRRREFSESIRFRGNARTILLPAELYNDFGVHVAPSPVFPLPFTPLPRQTTVLIVLFPQIAAVSAIFFPVIHVVVATVSIVVPPVTVMIVIGLHTRDRDKQGSAQQERTQHTFHRITLLNFARTLKATRQITCSLIKCAHSLWPVPVD